MGTQGIVSIVENGQTLLKVIAGCDGHGADDLAEALVAAGVRIAPVAYEMAGTCGFGCSDCLVVLDRDQAVGATNVLPDRYRDTFNDPRFNPRWERGTASFVAVRDITQEQV